LRLNFKKVKPIDMIIIPVKEGENIERALKRFKRKFEKTGVIKELRDRQKFTKPSVRRREELKKAAYVQGLQQQED
jgi:small subunit ribosomal protein S21